MRAMKNIFLISIVMLGLAACQPEPYKEIGPAYDLTTGVNGQWHVSKVEVTDLTLPVPESRDISDFYANGSPLEIDFDAEGGTYTVVDPQVSGNVFGAGGTFAYNDPEFPTKLTLRTTNQDTIVLSLGNMVRKVDPTMALKLVKSACGQDYISYNFTFNRR